MKKLQKPSFFTHKQLMQKALHLQDKFCSSFTPAENDYPSNFKALFSIFVFCSHFGEFSLQKTER